MPNTTSNTTNIQGQSASQTNRPQTVRCFRCHEPTTNEQLCNICSRDCFVCSRCRIIRYVDERNSETGWCHQCSNPIGRHGYTPTLVPLGNPPHLGTELEVESNGSYVQHANRVQAVLPEDFAILKSDGSLSEYGFEICTRPASLEEHRIAWEPFFNAHAERRFTLQSYTSERCGLHVHISRNSGNWNLSQHTIALIVCFVNLPKHKRFIECVAGRYANSYSEIIHKPMRTAARCTGDKYEAVNLCHPNTLEFRIFKGTLKKESFFKALEFTEAICRYCVETYNVRTALNVNNFCKFVFAHADRYAMLAAFLDNRWYGRNSQFALNPQGLQHWRLYNNRKPPLPPANLTEGGR